MTEAKLQGMELVIANLNKEIEKIKGKSLKGLILASIIVRRDMDKTQPLIPIDLGNLRASWFTVTAKTNEGTAASFKGDKAAQMQQDHAQSVANAKVNINKHSYPFLIMGFSANYALFVENNVGANFAGNAGKIKHTKAGNVTAKTKKYTRRAGAGAKFFESSLSRNKQNIINVIKQNVKIKK